MTSHRTAVERLLSPKLRRKVALEFDEHLHLHMPARPDRRISLVDGVSAGRAKVPAHAFSIAAALPSFSSNLGQLARSGLQDLAQVGVLLLIESPGGQYFLVEVGTSHEIAPSIRVTSGRSADALRRALAIIVAPRSKADTELRLLRVAALHFSALWRHDPGGQEDGVFVPFGDNFAGVKPGRVRSFAKLQKALKSAAVRLIVAWYERFERDRRIRALLPRTDKASRSRKS
jgi:hypothetical protein